MQPEMGRFCGAKLHGFRLATSITAKEFRQSHPRLSSPTKKPAFHRQICLYFMLEITRLRTDREAVAQGLAKRNITMGAVDAVLDIDDRRKAEQAELDAIQAKANSLSREIGKLMQSGKQQDAESLKADVADLKASLEPLQEQHNASCLALEDALIRLPNVPSPLVPHGKTPEDNEVFRAHKGQLPVLPKGALPHWDIGKSYNLFDLELGVKLTGAGFIVYRGHGAKLQRALINFFLDRATGAGYEEIMPPHLVNADSARGTGQLPDKEGQMYYVDLDELYLIPTAEVPVTNLHRGEILESAQLPIKYCAYTPCFRREAGSYGAHVRGLNRVHQFDKVEIVRFEHPDNSYAALDTMLEHVASLLDDLELPYRILRLCGGDMGFASALTYDFEVWSAAQERWLEVSSVSNFETFQSNRLGLRIREGKDKRLAHTLNGSALALPRIVAALLENHQSEAGINIPAALRCYTGFDVIPAP